MSFHDLERVFDLPLALLLEGEERVRSDPFLRVKNICGARGVRGCTVVSLAHAFCLPASACPLKDGATCFDE